MAKTDLLSAARAERASIIDDWRVLCARACNEELTVDASPPGFLKRRIYALAGRLARKKRFDVLRALDTRPGNRARIDNPNSDRLFHWLLSAIPHGELPRSERARYAEELQRARVAKVPVDYVVGYILQTQIRAPRKSRVKDT